MSKLRTKKEGERPGKGSAGYNAGIPNVCLAFEVGQCNVSEYDSRARMPGFRSRTSYELFDLGKVTQHPHDLMSSSVKGA